MRAKKAALNAASILVFGSVLAGRADAQDSYVEPHLITRMEPSVAATSGPSAGWSVVRYSVLADGRPTDIRVFDVVPRGTDRSPIVSAVQQWVFAPGRVNDEAVDWHNLESVVAFGAARQESDFSDAFLGRYESIGGLLEGESYEEALAENERLLTDSVSRSEVGLALAQQSLAHIGLGDWHSALRPLRLATDPRIPSLPAAELLSALQLRFQVEVELGRRSDALNTYRRIDYALDSEFANPYADIADLLAREWETVEPLPVIARVDEQPWRISAARRTFTVADVEGRIQGIRVECDRRVATLEYQPNAEWSLPESWGSCELFVDGDPGTTFVYYEFLSRQDPQG